MSSYNETHDVTEQPEILDNLIRDINADSDKIADPENTAITGVYNGDAGDTSAEGMVPENALVPHYDLYDDTSRYVSGGQPERFYQNLVNAAERDGYNVDAKVKLEVSDEEEAHLGDASIAVQLSRSDRARDVLDEYGLGHPRDFGDNFRVFTLIQGSIEFNPEKEDFLERYGE